jgi:release factor glutamine methyltransferase
MNALEKINEISGKLAFYGIDAAEQEAEMIVREVLRTDSVGLYRDNPDIPDDDIVKMDSMVARRLRHEPIQYILGHVDFIGLTIRVGPGVLIPRPETEFMVEHTLKSLTSVPRPLTILDLCTGSGCIALAMAKAFPGSMVYGIDISESAIGFANENAEINGIENVTFLQGDLYMPVPDGVAFDLIISNPPYIKSGQIEGLQPEVRDWEPLASLDGGRGGLDYYRRIIPGARKFLAGNGMLVLEIAPDVAQDVKDFAVMAGFLDVTVINDYSGRERVLTARWTR